MQKRQNIKQLLVNEISVFIYLWIALFLFMSLFGPAKNSVTVSLVQLAFVSNHAAMTALNNFLLMPHYLMRGRYTSYFLAVVILVLLFGFFEEFLLEQLLFTGGNQSGPRAEASLRGLGFAVFKSIFILALFSSYKLIWGYQRKQQHLKQLERDKIESELKFLKSQISPHVLLNNLNNIYSYALEGSAKTSDMILKLSALMRYMLYEAREHWVPLSKEVEYLRDYVDLQKIRLEDRGKVEFDVSGPLEERYIAPLLLVGFVENSFKHGMVVPGHQVYIRIHIEVEDGQLRFYAENSRDASSEHTRRKELDSNRGIGLENIKKRLQLLYPDKHQLQLEQDENRFYVYLTIPV